MVEKTKLLLLGVEPEFVDFFLIEFNRQNLFDLARKKFGNVEVQFLDIWEKGNHFLLKGDLIFYTGNNQLKRVEKREQ